MSEEVALKQKIAAKGFNWKWFSRACMLMFALVIVFEIALFCPLNRALLNMALFHPSAYPVGWYNENTQDGIKARDVYFKATDGKKIHAWYFEKPKSHFTVLLSHGNGGNISFRGDLIATLLRAGTSVLAYDYEGYGLSEGEPSIDTACDDSRCAYNYLIHQKSLAPEDIVLCGESLGTGITGNLASKVKCAGVILQCPFISVRQRAVEILPFEHIYPQSFYPENALDNSDVFSKVHAPLLIIGGVVDNVLPIHHSDQLFKISLEPKTYVRIDEAGHTGDPKLLQSLKYTEGLKTFLDSIERGKKVPIS